MLQDDPMLSYESITSIIGDIAPIGGDGKVDYLDLEEFARAWLAIPTSSNWNSKADIYGDAKVNFFDFAVLADHWQDSLSY